MKLQVTSFVTFVSSSFGDPRAFRNCVLTVIALAATFLLSACGSHTIEMKGVVRGFGADMSKVFVTHEAVEGMSEMTMAFNADSAAVVLLDVGDTIAFRLHVAGDRSWITDISRVPRRDVSIAEEGNAPNVGTEIDSLGVMPLFVGAELAEVELIDHRGTTFRTPHSSGVTLVDFIYTRCPLPDYCPLLSRRFREVQKATGSDVTLVSVTIDPDYDTPDVLLSYARRYGAEYPRWRFATGDESTLKRLYAAAGVNIFGTQDILDHNLATILFDERGRVARIWRDTDGTVEEMLSEIALH